MGWGAIAKQRNAGEGSAKVTPGIGWIMSGGHGHGQTDAADAGKAKGKASPPAH
jgi:hypothetical protein